VEMIYSQVKSDLTTDNRPDPRIIPRIWLHIAVKQHQRFNSNIRLLHA
jgi:hypothetical protein